MRTLDRYILRELLIPILYCSITLILLLIMADVFDNLDEMLRNKTALSEIFRYYMYLVPIAFVQTISWATFLGTLYVLVTFNHHHELVAMKVSGLGIFRIAGPLVFMGFMVGMATFLVNDWVVPWTHQRAQVIRHEKIEGRTLDARRALHNITYASPHNRLFFARQLDPKSRSLREVIVIYLDQARRIKKKVVAKEAVWQDDHWLFRHVSMYNTDTQGKLIGEPRVIPEDTLPEITETFPDFIVAAKESDLLSFKELRSRVEKMAASGVDARNERVVLNMKLAAPWQSLVAVLICIPFLARTQTRRRVALNVLYCLALIFCYHMLNAFSLALGKSGALPPLVSAWLGIFLFGSASVFFLETANQ